MSKKGYGYWRGRPNEPPLNWNTPGRPVIRKVASSSYDVPSAQVLRGTSKQDDSQSIAVTLTNDHWIRILKALYKYGQSHGNADWEEWRMKVRRAILGGVNANRDKTQPVTVRLSIEDWRAIWQQVHTASQELGDNWCTWFDWLSQTMAAQIKGG